MQVQEHLYIKIRKVLNDPLYPSFNSSRLKNMGIMIHLVRVLMDVPPLSVVVEVVSVIKELLKDHPSSDDITILSRFLSLSLVKDTKPYVVNKENFNSLQIQQGARFSRLHRSQVIPPENVVAAANLKVDSTPMEGFDYAAFDEILGLKEKGLQSAVALALGYRDEEADFLAKLKK